MRGDDTKQAALFSFVSPEQRVPQDHPLRPVKALTERILTSLSRTFSRMYSKTGRPSIPPERLLKAQILMALYTVRSDRLFCEQLDYNLLFRWFLDMTMDEPSFDHSSFTKNRERLLKHEVAAKFFAAVVVEARELGLMSNEHFSVDGTLIEAWASLKSFRPKDETPEDRDPPDDPGNPTVNFHGEKRSNETHASTTDPESRLARKGNGKEARLSFSTHALMENRNGLVVALEVAMATGTAERDVGLEMIGEHVPRGGTVGGDKGYNQRAFVEGCRALGVTPHVAEKTDRPAHNSMRRLHREHADPKAHRGDLRLDQDHWRPAPHPRPRHQTHAARSPHRRRRAQSPADYAADASIARRGRGRRAPGDAATRNVGAERPTGAGETRSLTPFFNGLLVPRGVNLSPSGEGFSGREAPT